MTAHEDTAPLPPVALLDTHSAQVFRLAEPSGPTVGKRPFFTIALPASAGRPPVKIRALYDTGAGPSCISAETFKQAKAAGAVTPNNHGARYKVLAAGGEELPVQGAYDLQCSILGSQTSVPVLVIPQLAEQMIAGMNLISKECLHCDPTSLVISRKPGLCAVTVAKETAINPGEAVVTPVRLHGRHF